MLPRTGSAILFASFIFALSCDDLPRDQSGTFDGIKRSGRMRVGLIENPPWVIRTGGEPAGAEVDMIRQFASETGATPEWHWGGEEKSLGALEKYELDLVIGGLSDQTPWYKRVGLTKQYFEEKIDIGVPTGQSLPDKLEGQQIAVSDARVAGFVREEGAVPVETEDLKSGRLVAAPEWQLAKLGLSPSRNELHSDRHVVAVPPGENQLVKRLEEFLSKQRDQIPAILQQQPEASK